MLRAGLRPRRILLLVCAGIVASAVLRATLYGWSPSWQHIWVLYLGLPTRADTLLIGCLVGLLAAWDMLPRSPRFLCGSGAAALASIMGLICTALLVRHPSLCLYRGLFTVVALMVAAILVRLLLAPSALARWALESAILVGIGRISYGLYLFHFPIILTLLPPERGQSSPGMKLLAVCLSFAAALVSFHCIERPCLRLKERLQVLGRVRPAEAAA
jgi:peptidoglycan/LPS O-acetylase OafA/YrhL